MSLTKNVEALIIGAFLSMSRNAKLANEAFTYSMDNFYKRNQNFKRSLLLRRFVFTSSDPLYSLLSKRHSWSCLGLELRSDSHPRRILLPSSPKKKKKTKH